MTPSRKCALADVHIFDRTFRRRLLEHHDGDCASERRMGRPSRLLAAARFVRLLAGRQSPSSPSALLAVAPGQCESLRRLRVQTIGGRFRCSPSLSARARHGRVYCRRRLLFVRRRVHLAQL